jgi:hypothetical protein
MRLSQAAVNAANALSALGFYEVTYQTASKSAITEDQIKRMVDRFLCWRLPDDFSPDCGIHFDAEAPTKLHSANRRYEPVGTNLFTAHQAEAMVRHMLAD